MGNFLGSKHTLGLKPQSTPGTAETTVSTFLATERLNMAANPTHVPRRSHIGQGVDLPQRAGWINPNGSATHEVHASQPHPWYWLLGAVATSTPTTGVYLHTITEDDEPVLLTVEGDMVYGDKKQADAYLNQISVNAKVGEIATQDLAWLALSHDDDPTLTSTPVFTTDPLVCTAVSVKLDGTQVYVVDGVQISVDRLLEQLPVLTNVSGGQPQLIRKTKAPEVTGTVDFIDFPAAHLEKMVAATEFALILELQGVEIETSYNAFLRITLPSCQWVGGLDTEAGEEMMTGSGEFKAAYDTVTSTLIKVEAQNAIATINT